MSSGDMVQIHMLTAYPATLLNRDDTGLAKRIPFGGVVRTRISSQCLKKHWRDAPGITEFGDLADRSTRIYENRVAKPLMEKHGASETDAQAIASFLMAATVDTKPVKDTHGNETARSGQMLVLTRAETDFLAEKGAEILEAMREASADPLEKGAIAANTEFLKDPALKKILKALPASIDTALFGRMVTSDLFARVDAAVSVAHAFTTHAEAAETDYFTAIDTLKTTEEDAGAGLIQDTELTSGVFYLYCVIDMNQLRDNLGAQEERAEQLAKNLISAMATVSPGAKRGSTAPFAYAEFVLLERGSGQPRTLANAFLDPVPGRGDGLMRESVGKLLEYRRRLEAMYGSADAEVTVSTIHDLGEDPLRPLSLSEALTRIHGQGE